MDTLAAFVVAASALGIHYYFHSRRHLPLEHPEAFFAFAWLVIRRFFCALGVLICSFAIVFWCSRLATGDATFESLGGLFLFAGLGWLFSHVFVYGAGYSRYDFGEDKPIHELRKKRYGWRW